MAGPEKRFVYVLRSERDSRPYVGVTSDVRQRVETHNSGGSLYEDVATGKVIRLENDDQIDAFFADL